MTTNTSSFGLMRILGYENDNSKSVTSTSSSPPTYSHAASEKDLRNHNQSHSSSSRFVHQSGPETSTSSAHGNGATTLELHPNVVLGLGDDDDQSNEGTRPHLCTICHASYKTRTHLRRHMFIHMTSRPFPCPDCGKGFNRREHLNKHTETVHGRNKHTCPYCHKTISRTDHLKRHIKNMHTNKKSTALDKGAILKVQMACGQKHKAQISFLTPHFPSGTGTIGQTIITPIPIGGNSDGRGAGGSIFRSTSSTQSFISTDRSRSDSGSGVEEDSTLPSMTINPSNILGSSQGVATLSVQSTPTQRVLVHQRLPAGSELNMTTAANGLAGLANLNLTLGGHPHPISNQSDKKTHLPIFNCGQCSSTFTTEKDLDLHARSHKPQPHRCPECPRAYTRREKLTEHIRCVHKGQKFDCEHCGKKTFSKGSRPATHSKCSSGSVRCDIC